MLREVPREAEPKAVPVSKRHSSGQAERRTGQPAIPDNLDFYLSQEQMDSLHTMEYFGWQLAFVRRSDLNNIMPVIFHGGQGEYAVLEIGGDVIRAPDIGIRPAC